MRSLQTRVALGALAAVAITLIAVLVVVVSTFASNERQALDRQIQRSSIAIRTAVTAPPAQRGGGQPGPPPGAPGNGGGNGAGGNGAGGNGAAGTTPNDPPNGRRPQPVRALTPLTQRVRDATGRNGESVQVLSLDGQLLASNGPAISGLTVPERNGKVVTASAGGREYRVIARAAKVERPNATPVRGRVVVAAETAPMEDRIDDLRNRVIVIGLLGLLIAGGIALLLARVALRSLRRLRTRAAELAEPTADGAHLPRGGPSEVDDLAGTLNAMLDRLAATAREREAALIASRRFAADVGHELRTPLAALGANVDTLRAHPDIPEREQMLTELQHDQRRMASLLGALQALARADAAEAIPREPVDVAELADIAVQAVGRRHPEVPFTLTAPEGEALVRGWPDGLRLALDNLLENAARHGGTNGPVHTTVTVTGNGAEITVDDHGPGIPEAERAQVLERFARGSSARGPGSGLGLALVAQQAALHDGALTVEDAPSGGARLRLTLRR